jgi:hypothetical protein
MNTKDLIKKASSGNITQQEIQDVYNALINHTGDKYELLLILGRAGTIQYRKTVEQYLSSPDDPMLARLALQILCQYWGLTREYKDTIEQYIRRVDWDEEEDVRLMAISCSGAILMDESNAELLSLVYDIFRSDKENEITRGAAYEALAIASGKSVYDIPQPIHFDLNKDVDQSVIEKIKNQIQFGK